MKVVKNILFGFGISFIGSLPLGYLNVIGYELYTKAGFNSLIAFITGVMSIEVIVIYLTLLFAKKISNRKKLLKYIELFSIVFLLLLAVLFYFSHDNQSPQDSILSKYIHYPPYFIGVICSCFNFIQLPFWTGWNLYFVGNKYVVTGKHLKYYYIAGTLVGTFAGMLGFVFLLKTIAGTSEDISANLMKIIIPLIFLGLAIFQTYKFYRKYYR